MVFSFLKLGYMKLKSITIRKEIIRMGSTGNRKMAKQRANHRNAVKIIWFLNFVGIAFIVCCYLMCKLKEEDSGLTYAQLYFDKDISKYSGTIPESLLGLMERNPEAKDFVLNYPDRETGSEKIDLTKDLEEEGIPLFLQWDERWGYEKYGDDFLAVTGCGPTCLAMVCCGLSSDTVWNPCEVAKMAEEEGYYVDGAGSSWELMESGAKELGLTVLNIIFDEKHILEALMNDQPIICAVRAGDFTTTGHFIVLAGVDEDGGVIVNDPNSIINSEKSWKISELIPQIKNLWGYTFE